MMTVNMLHQLRTGGSFDFSNIERVGAHFVPITGMGGCLKYYFWGRCAKCRKESTARTAKTALDVILTLLLILGALILAPFGGTVKQLPDLNLTI